MALAGACIRTRPGQRDCTAAAPASRRVRLGASHGQLRPGVSANGRVPEHCLGDASGDVPLPAQLTLHDGNDTRRGAAEEEMRMRGDEERDEEQGIAERELYRHHGSESGAGAGTYSVSGQA